ncbi:immune inhibitor A [bacterium]|nr:immune inhibitor A [bacterium]
MKRRFPRSYAAAVLLGTVACLRGPCASGADPAPGGDTELSRWRTERRAAFRAASVGEQKTPFSCGLLVIPVDFADFRLVPNWHPAVELAPRLAGLDGETLERYFTAASRSEGWLRIILAPLVHLTGDAVDYSDLFNPFGYARTRALAGEAIRGADAAGVPFAAADADGDGFLDGVLILHAAPGRENDPVGGYVIPLQYFLEEPYLQDGVGAQHYAVASLRSGLGVWVHETAHLLGLEDRYDLSLSPGADSSVSRGGLGVFSLMAAGAWGRGDGSGAALLDAYSAAQLGWVEVAEPGRGSHGTVTLGTHDVLKLPVGDTVPGEYFLLEVRGGYGDAPFDALLTSPRLLVYHVDGSVRDDADSGGAKPHLRVRLVEADGDADLANGLSLGAAEDMFPGADGTFAWNDESVPSSNGYHGPSGIDCVFSLLEDSVAVTYDLPGHGLRVLLMPEVAGGDSLIGITVLGPDQGDASLSIVVTHLTGLSDWGTFSPGTDQVQRDLLPAGEGVWTLAEPIVWLPDGPPPDGATSTFLIGLGRDGASLDLVTRTWLWRQSAAPLDFAATWPGDWLDVSPDIDGTSWHRWTTGAAVGLPGTPVLACTGEAYTDGTSWPDVVYGNDSDARLQSPPFATGSGVLRLVHALDAHAWEPGRGIDGAQVTARTDDGSYRTLTPFGGYDGAVDGAADNPLHGQPAFIGGGELTDGAAPLWRVDLFPLPAEATGWTRLRLRLTSDPSLWRGRGWLVSRLDLVPVPASPSPFAAVWDAARGGLALSWPWEPPEWITVESSLDNGTGWTTVWEGGVPNGQSPADMLIPAAQMVLPPTSRDQRTMLRARVRIDVGEVVSRAGRFGTPPPEVTLSLGPPRPNPFGTATRFLVQTELLASHLGVFDLRGREVRGWWLARGSYLMDWDGHDDEGRPAPAGVYVLRLVAYDDTRAMSRKVTLIR